jgi:GxxExxY protein
MKMEKEIKEIVERIMNELGIGYSESIYHEAMCVELRERGIKYTKEKNIEIKYKDIGVGFMRIDIYIEEHKIIIEVKAITKMNETQENQLKAYLNNTEAKTGYLINFNKGEIICINKETKEIKKLNN